MKHFGKMPLKPPLTTGVLTLGQVGVERYPVKIWKSDAPHRFKWAAEWLPKR